MNFRYRFVPFGTAFVAMSGTRPESETRPELLFDNELATDVGGVCWNYDGESRPIIDHHLVRRGGQYPSAAAAVLHLAGLIAGRFSGQSGTIWLVTHREPDFDAHCSAYLARKVIEGVIPAEGWEPLGLAGDGWQATASGHRFDWFAPRLGDWPVERLWSLLLAAYASHVDCGRRLICPRERRLHSVLYAAVRRGRHYEFPDCGATEFFDEAVSRMMATGSGGARGIARNPLFDDVLQNSELFAPEREMLQREIENYHRDVAAAQKTVVFLQESLRPFVDWFTELQGQPLLDDSGAVSAPHLSPGNSVRRAADAIFLRDPECVMFKEWAREDRESSSLGEGFLFTGIAYSGERLDAPVNSTAYYFSLPPERAGRRHLYGVWARLQSAEVRSLQQLPPDERPPFVHGCRGGFEGRAQGAPPGTFADPWFDGANYNATIVVSANHGTVVAPPGDARNLGDDPIVEIVRRELESAAFSQPLLVESFYLGGEGSAPATESMTVHLDRPRFDEFNRQNAFLLIDARLSNSIDLDSEAVSHQIARVLWRVLHADRGRPLTDAMIDGHVVIERDRILVWSEQGIGRAAKERVGESGTLFRETFHRLSELFRNLRQLESSWTAPADEERRTLQAERLLREMALIRRSLASAEGQIVQKFLDASGIDNMLQTIRDLSSAAIGRLQAQRVNSNVQAITSMQQVFEMLEYFIVGYYSVEIWQALSGHAESHSLVGRLVNVLVPFLTGGLLADFVNQIILGHSPLLHLLHRRRRSPSIPGDKP